MNAEKTTELCGQEAVNGRCRDKEGQSEALKNWGRKKILDMAEIGLP